MINRLNEIIITISLFTFAALRCGGLTFLGGNKMHGREIRARAEELARIHDSTHSCGIGTNFVTHDCSVKTCSLL